MGRLLGRVDDALDDLAQPVEDAGDGSLDGLEGARDRTLCLVPPALRLAVRVFLRLCRFGLGRRPLLLGVGSGVAQLLTGVLVRRLDGGADLLVDFFTLARRVLPIAVGDLLVLLAPLRALRLDAGLSLLAKRFLLGARGTGLHVDLAIARLLDLVRRFRKGRLLLASLRDLLGDLLFEPRLSLLIKPLAFVLRNGRRNQRRRRPHRGRGIRLMRGVKHDGMDRRSDGLLTEVGPRRRLGVRVRGGDGLVRVGVVRRVERGIGLAGERNVRLLLRLDVRRLGGGGGLRLRHLRLSQLRRGSFAFRNRR